VIAINFTVFINFILVLD